MKNKKRHLNASLDRKTSLPPLDTIKRNFYLQTGTEKRSKEAG
jgi:hypothetical protein